MLERLMRDYPSSPPAEEAGTWHRALSTDPATSPVPAPPGEEEPPEMAVLLPAAIPALRDSMEASWSFAVQVGAFSSLERAGALADRLRNAGYQPRVVGISDDELARVRVGRFPVREEADALARELASRGFEVRVVSDAWSEERVGTGEGMAWPYG
jgi:cell division septation protein DedD